MRSIFGGLAALSLVAVAAAPAEARHRYRDRGDIDGGDVVAGALVVGAIAAIISSNGKAKQDRAVGLCSAEAEGRIGGPISDIFGVIKRKGYYTVEGAVEVDGGGAERFTCTVRRGLLYSFRSGPSEA
ncbi:MAG TPA: hypothetical protein VGB70_00380 [Allosphingosinicella sp.]|jgi:hypothetical protein